MNGHPMLTPDRSTSASPPVLPERERAALEALRYLIRASHLSRADDLPSLVRTAAACLGAVATVVYVVDYDQVLLVSLPDSSAADRPVVHTIEGTLAGRAFRDVATQLGSVEGNPVVWTSMLDGSDRLGVLEFTFPASVRVDEHLARTCEDMAGLVAELLLTHSRHGDAVERARRRVALSVPAELQWHLLPPLTFVSPRVSVAGVVAPSSQVAGDSFDYSINGDVAHIAIIDAMGHGLQATLMAAVTIATLRNARRRGLDVAEMVPVLDRQIATAFGSDRFVTGIFGELDTLTGEWRWTTCGHPPTLVIRGGRVVKRLDSVIGAPLGLGLLGGEPELAVERLEPGDRLLLYSDGVIEARDATGGFFGTDRLVDFIVRQASAGLPAAESLRRLNLEILHHQEGELQDDATTLMVEWLTDEPSRTFR